jgi:hypothetical protein
MYFKTLQEHDYLTLCNFRTANHKLPVETGRYDGTPFEDRICELCQSGSVACEHHYLIDCPFFQQERERYLDPLNIRHYDRTLKTLLSSTSQHVLQNLCKFIRVIMTKFRSWIPMPPLHPWSIILTLHKQVFAKWTINNHMFNRLINYDVISRAELNLYCVNVCLPCLLT